MKKIVLAGLLLLGIYFLWGQKETWLGFYYPDGCLICQDKYIFSPQFDNREACFAWATNLKRERGNRNDTFECGMNCDAPDTPDGVYICEKTVD